MIFFLLKINNLQQNKNIKAKKAVKFRRKNQN